MLIKDCAKCLFLLVCMVIKHIFPKLTFLICDLSLSYSSFRDSCFDYKRRLFFKWQKCNGTLDSYLTRFINSAIQMFTHWKQKKLAACWKKLKKMQSNTAAKGLCKVTMFNSFHTHFNGRCLSSSKKSFSICSHNKQYVSLIWSWNGNYILE